MAASLSPPELDDLIPPRARAALGSGVTGAIELAGGRHVNLCLRIERTTGPCVLRLRRGRIPQPGADSRREIACQRAAAAAGLAPAVRAADAEEGWILMDFIAAEPWTIEALLAPGAAERLCARLGALHAVPAPALRPFDAAALLADQARVFRAAGQVLPAALDEAAGLIQALEAEPPRAVALCHGDLDVGNLLGPAPLLIDFEYAQLADPTYDLACLVAYYPALEARAESLLAAAGLGDAASRRRFPLQLRFSRLVNEVWARIQSLPAPELD